MTRNQSAVDRILISIDEAWRTVFAPARAPQRPNPAASTAEAPLDTNARREVGALMRINHTGEICAQALYQGQALTARLPLVRQKMEQAANEEIDHLAWTETRIRELGTHTSYLNPLWYAGSFAIGAFAGAIGDRWSLGFVAETERQVVAHLERHLARLPSGDDKSRRILEQMRDDEGHHATTALEAGAAQLPDPIQRLMRAASKVMTRITYWI